MSDARSSALSLDLIGKILRDIQAEQRTLRTETGQLRKDLTNLASSVAGGMARLIHRDDMADALRLIMDRIGNFEALMETRFDQLASRLPEPPQ